ncbi:unnamed protein product, partial [Rotaria sp. Silwood1]
NHKTLMDERGVYYGLVEAQNLHVNDKDRKTDENDEDDDISGKARIRFEKNSVQMQYLGSNKLTFSTQKQLIIDDDELNQSTRISVHNKSCHNKSIEEDQISQKAEQINESQETAILLKQEDHSFDHYSGRSPFLTVLRMNSPEWFYIILACLACICNGGVQPAFGVILSKMIAVFEECDPKQQEKHVLTYVFFFISIGLIILFTTFLQNFLFAISGETLTQRLRAKIFQTLLKQDIAYFDRPENNTGALCTRLATEASDVQGATGIRIGTMLQNIANLGVGIILAFIYSWSLTLVMLAFVPFMIVAGFLQMYLLTGFTNNDKKALENAGKVTVESISNIRTVAQLTKEKYFDDEYCKLLDVCFKNSIKRANIFGLVFGFTDAIMFFAMAALFSFGAWRVEQGAMTFENVMLILNCILFGAMAVGQTSSMAPDYSKAINSSKKILVLFKRVPQIDNCSNAGKILENFDGQIGLNNLDFHYPNRQEVQVLKNFNLTIEPRIKKLFV